MILLELCTKHLHKLCVEIKDRRLGGPGNILATDYFLKCLNDLNWECTSTPLSVMDWKTRGASLSCGEKEFEVHSSHYSLACSVSGELMAVDSIEKLRSSAIQNKIVLLHGAIASEQIMPKNFVFYNPDSHQEIIQLLETGKPLALLCATERNAATAGGVYPFPLFEDGDFDIPSVFMKDTEGEKLLDCLGQQVTLFSAAERIPARAYNIIANKAGSKAQRIVVSAHIDAKIGTPGAIDNATGVTVLLLLAELLKDYRGKYGIELAAFNGEDYYAVSGQMKYIEQNHNNFEQVALNINIDGAGYHEGPSCFSAFELPADMKLALDKVIETHPAIVEGLPWFQGDHSIFLQYGRPAIAVSSDWFIKHMNDQDITHTPKDNLSIVRFDRVVEAALGIEDFIRQLK